MLNNGYLYKESSENDDYYMMFNRKTFRVVFGFFKYNTNKIFKKRFMVFKTLLYQNEVIKDIDKRIICLFVVCLFWCLYLILLMLRKNINIKHTVYHFSNFLYHVKTQFIS